MRTTSRRSRAWLPISSEVIQPSIIPGRRGHCVPHISASAQLHTCWSQSATVRLSAWLSGSSFTTCSGACSEPSWHGCPSGPIVAAAVSSPRSSRDSARKQRRQERSFCTGAALRGPLDSTNESPSAGYPGTATCPARLSRYSRHSTDCAHERSFAVCRRKHWDYNRRSRERGGLGEARSCGKHVDALWVSCGKAVREKIFARRLRTFSPQRATLTPSSRVASLVCHRGIRRISALDKLGGHPLGCPTFVVGHSLKGRPTLVVGHPFKGCLTLVGRPFKGRPTIAREHV